MPIIFNKKELEVEIARLLSDIENKIGVENKFIMQNKKTSGDRSSCVNTPAFLQLSMQIQYQQQLLAADVSPTRFLKFYTFLVEKTIELANNKQEVCANINQFKIIDNPELTIENNTIEKQGHTEQNSLQADVNALAATVSQTVKQNINNFNPLFLKLKTNII